MPAADGTRPCVPVANVGAANRPGINRLRLVEEPMAQRFSPLHRFGMPGIQ